MIKLFLKQEDFGHGVGMSQYGANGIAKEGYSYKNILKHYYPGTILKVKIFSFTFKFLII